MSRAIAIELTDVDAKVVQMQATRKKGVTLERAFRVSFEGIPREAEDAPARRAERLRDALREHKCAVAPVALVLPKQAATVRRVRLPTTDPEELASMVQFEAEKFIPFNPENHIIDYTILSSNEMDGTEALVVAMDEGVVGNWLASLEGTKLEPALCDISSLAAVTALQKSVSEEALEGMIAVVHVGRQHTDITFVLDGQVVTTRSILHGTDKLLELSGEALNLGRSLTVDELRRLSIMDPSHFVPDGGRPAPREDEFEVVSDKGTVGSPLHAVVDEWRSKLVTNLRRTYEFALREYRVPFIRAVFLSGEGALIPDISGALIIDLNVSVEVFNPLAGVQRDPKADVEEHLLPEMTVASGSALRLAQDEVGLGINLLPYAVLQRQIQAERRFQYFVTGFMALVALTMVGLLFSSEAQHRKALAANLDAIDATLTPLVEDVADMERRIEIIKGIKSNRAGALDVLDAVSQYPQINPVHKGGRMTLIYFRFFLNDRAEFRGHALDITDVNAFIDHLERLQLDLDGVEGTEQVFSSVRLLDQSTDSLPGRDRTIYEFRVEALLN